MRRNDKIKDFNYPTMLVYAIINIKIKEKYIPEMSANGIKEN